MEPLDPPIRHRDLSAFADGELDAAATRRVLAQLLADPASLATLRQIQQLTTATRRVVSAHVPTSSEALLHRLSQMAVPPAPTPARSPAASWSAWTRAVAAVALLAVGVWAGTWLARPAAPVDGPDRADVLPASVVAHAEEVHGVCSRLALGLHTGGYPADVAALATTVERDLHGPHPYPDLAAIGYRYRGAGPCGQPLADTAHLLYRSVRPGSVNAVSVFVQAWRDQYRLAPGRLYTVSVDQSPFPMLAWRTERVVYFLLADDATTERAAIALIRGAPTMGGPSGDQR